MRSGSKGGVEMREEHQLAGTVLGDSTEGSGDGSGTDVQRRDVGTQQQGCTELETGVRDGETEAS